MDEGAHTFDLAIGAAAERLFFDNVDVASVLDEKYFVEMCREAKASSKELESKCCKVCSLPYTGGILRLYGQANKRTRWMPWRSEAMKDVAACEKARGVGNKR